MRQGQQNKRMRGRNRKGPNPLTRSFESNGPDVKIRGTALHIAEKYVQLARDAQSSGDRVAAENYLQHAEHYYRIVAAAQAQMPQPQQVFRNDDEEGDEEDDRFSSYGERGYGERPAPYPQQQGGQPGYNASEPQPYVNGNGGGMPRAEGEEGGAPFEENRPQEGQNREHRDYREGGGGYRGRRRRPYRDRFGGGNDQQNEQRGEAPYQGNPAPAPSNTPSED
jgi:hypothetical protein